MAHINDTAPRTIYAIIDSDNHTFYIGKTYPHRIRKTYSEHIHGRVRKTREMFDGCDIPHPFYILEEAEMPTAIAFRHCVAWTRFFLDHGYTQTFPDILSDYAMDMLPDTQRIYDTIKNYPLNEILSSDKMLLPPKEKSVPERKTDCIQFSIRFTPQEYERVKTLTQQHNFLSVTAYCKHMVIAGRVIELDLSLISEFISYYRDIKTLLRQILLAIYKTGKYYPADMTNIQKCIDRMGDYSDQVLDAVTDLLHTINRDGYEDV